jgi:hypothetical protein
MDEHVLMVPGFKHFGGRQPEAAALRHVLAQLGVVAPHTGEPFGEALLFGIGGGIGLGYFVYESAGSTTLFLATRLTTEETARPGFMLNMCERLGVRATVQSSSSAAAAEKKLRQALAAGRAPIVWVDPRRLPYYGAPNVYYTLVVYGFDAAAGRVSIADRCPAPILITPAQLAEARQGEGAIKFRALLIEPPDPAPDIALAVRRGIEDCCAQMRVGFGPANFKSNFGLRALEKWAGLLADGQDRRGWPAFFPPGPRLFAALASASDQIENRGGGGAFRELYADFLVEAGAILSRPELADVAARFRESARLWSQLGAALLPESVALFREARQLAARKRALFERHGAAANDEIRLIDTRLDEIRAYVAETFPLSAAEVVELLADLRVRVLAIHALESAAVAALEKQSTAL